jgi:uncharacterized protein YqgC (DUF456 family)
VEKKKPLWEDIIAYTSSKNKLGLGLILLGLIGLILPLIPGILLVALGVLILKPEWYEVLKKKLKS